MFSSHTGHRSHSSRPQLPLPVALAGVLAALLTGCAVQNPASPVAEPGVSLQGRVYGGQQPVTGSHIHLMAAGTSGYGGAANSLLTIGTAGSDAYGGYVLTDSNGNFSITGDYTCVPGTQAYVLATGGNPGLPNNQTNANLALIAAIGQCPTTLTYLQSVPLIFINEVSTAASVYAMAGYMTDLSHVSSSGTPLAITGIANAFATAKNLFSINQGVAYATTPAGNGTVPQAELNTLANIIASCVNTAAASSMQCSILFSNAVNGSTQPTDTVTAALNIAHNPAANVGNLFNLQAAVAAPFGPALSAAPSDFTVALSFTGGGLNGPTSLAIDGTGNVWLVNAATVSEFNGVTGAAISPAAGYTGNGLTAPFAIAIDPSNNAWVVNTSTYNYVTGALIAPTQVSKFTPGGGTALNSPYTGGGLNIGPGINVLSPRDIAFDALGNAWIADSGNGSATQLNGTTGVALSPATGYPLASTQTNPSGIAVDGAQHVWVSGFNGNTLYELSALTGAQLGASAYRANGLEQPYSIAIDASNNVWLPNQFDPNTLVGATISEFTSVTGGNLYSGGGILGPVGVAIDGASNVWIANQIHTNPSATAGLTELNNAGTPLSPSVGFTSSYLFSPGDVGVDASGNVWASNSVAQGSYTNGLNLVEFVGAAVPVATPIATAVGTNKLGQRP